MNKTGSGDKVSFWRKVGYGSGMLSYNIQANTLSQMANPVFNDCLGVDPRWIGTILGVSRIWDAVTDPIMGNISDNTRSRWGRRVPWITLSALLCGISFAAIWLFPRGMSESFYIFWLLLSSLIFYVGFTVFSVPYIALGMELSPDYHERTSVVAYRSVMAQFGGFVVSSLFWATSLTRWADRAEGMQYVGIAVGILVFLITLIPALTSREHPSLIAVGKKQNKTSIALSVKETMRHVPFLLLIGVTVFMLMGLTMVNHLGYYVGVYHVFGGNKGIESGRALAFMGYGYQIGTIAAIPVLTWISKRIGKRATMLGAMILAFFGTLSKWFCFSPANPHLIFIPSLVMAAGMAGVWTLINAMLPDVVDLDELKTGTRREGMFSAIYSWTFKMGVALALVLSGFILKWSGFNAALGAQQTPAAILTMRILFTAVPALVIVVGFILMRLYPLTEKRAYEIRKGLEARRNTAGV
ncbi:MAG: MFS transporter [Kiritimatiellales bacterium]